MSEETESGSPQLLSETVASDEAPPLPAEEGQGEERAEVEVEEVEEEIGEAEPEVEEAEVVPSMLAPEPKTTEVMRETTAQWLALGVLGIFGFVVILFLILSFVNFWLIYFNAPAPQPEGGAPPTFEAVKVAETVLPYLATPLGVALGYYFTKERARG